MIEVHITYNFIPNVDENDYFKWIKKAIVPVLRSPGLIEIRAMRNAIGSPFILINLKWEKLSDWTRLDDSEDWDNLVKELGRQFAKDITINVWGPSPVIPEPIRPPKRQNQAKG